MIVIADSSPLNYLILIDVVHVLPQLFDRIVIPEAVALELRSPAAPTKVALWMSKPPDWLLIRQPIAPLDYDGSERLDQGERDAIALALPDRAEALLLIDESKGRRVAQRLEIRFMGTLGALDKAATQGLIDFSSIIERLLQTNFYVTPEILKILLERHIQGKKAR